MLNLNVIGTGSKGNCYILKNSMNKGIIIELGVSIRAFASREVLSNIECCLVSHTHSDHLSKMGSITSAEFLKEHYNIETYYPDNTAPMKWYETESFKFIPIENKHNITCYSYYIIDKVENISIMFSTDTSMIPKINKSFDIGLLECNYDMETLQGKIDNTPIGDSNLIHLYNVANNHHSLEKLKAYLEQLESKPKFLIAIHKSNSGNLNEERALSELKELVNETYIAKTKDIYRFDKEIIRDVRQEINERKELKK